MCMGQSANLDATECEIWATKIYDGMGGPKWQDCSDSRLDPCGCTSDMGCDDGGEHITQMYVHSSIHHPH